jgi:hypothetical protein
MCLRHGIRRWKERLAQGHMRVCVRACVQSYVRVQMMKNVRVCPAVRRDHAGAGVVSGCDHQYELGKRQRFIC